MTNIENLKQAKQYLRWHRERYHPVAAILRTTLPRFRGEETLKYCGRAFISRTRRGYWLGKRVSIDGRRSFQVQIL